MTPYFKPSDFVVGFTHENLTVLRDSWALIDNYSFKKYPVNTDNTRIQQYKLYKKGS